MLYRAVRTHDFALVVSVELLTNAVLFRFRAAYSTVLYSCDTRVFVFVFSSFLNFFFFFETSLYSTNNKEALEGLRGNDRHHG